MTDPEATVFAAHPDAAHPDAADAARLRRWDDAAKAPTA